MILAGRRINDSMGQYVAGEVVKLMIKNGHTIANSKVLVLGITFKENCPDIRNSRVIDVIRELEEFGCAVDVYDPWADPDEVQKEYGVSLLTNHESRKYDAVVLAVAHRQFVEMDLKKLTNGHGILYDVKGIAPEADGRL